MNTLRCGHVGNQSAPANCATTPRTSSVPPKPVKNSTSPDRDAPNSQRRRLKILRRIVPTVGRFRQPNPPPPGPALIRESSGLLARSRA